MKDNTKPTNNKLLRRQVYDLLGVEIPPKSLFRAVTMLITLRHPEDIARIIKESSGKTSLKPAKVAELLRSWYPSKKERDNRFPLNARKIFFRDEFPADIRPEPVQVTKNSPIKTAKPVSHYNAGFVPMGEFNPERPFRASIVGKQITLASPVSVQESVDKPVDVIASDVFTPEFFDAMRARIPAAQHHAFRKFVFEKRMENRSAAQWIDIWILNNTPGTHQSVKSQSEKLVKQVDVPAPVVMKVTAEGSRRTIYQRDASAQARFKSRLMTLWKGKCGIENVALSGVLEAAHITHGEDFSDDNGILMTPTMHALFDRHLIGIEPYTLMIHVSRTLPELQHLEGTQLNPPLPLNLTGLVMRWALYQQTSSN